MQVGDLVSYRHDNTGEMQGIVVEVRKKYITSGPPERALVHWVAPAYYDNEANIMDWVDDLEVISESR